MSSFFPPEYTMSKALEAAREYGVSAPLRGARDKVHNCVRCDESENSTSLAPRWSERPTQCEGPLKQPKILITAETAPASRQLFRDVRSAVGIALKLHSNCSQKGSQESQAPPEVYQQRGRNLMAYHICFFLHLGELAAEQLGHLPLVGSGGRQFVHHQFRRLHHNNVLQVVPEAVGSDHNHIPGLCSIHKSGRNLNTS
eukprot:1177563-Prorocentrum_minimum.AAC.1